MSDFNDLYQELILDHNRQPRNRGSIDGAALVAEGFNPLCGDRVEVFVTVVDGVIDQIKFDGTGCAISTASASLMTESLKGKTLAEAKALFRRFRDMVVDDAEDSEDGAELGKLAVFSGVCRYPARVKCATLAWHTVSAALDRADGLVTTE